MMKRRTKEIPLHSKESGVVRSIMIFTKGFVQEHSICPV